MLEVDIAYNPKFKNIFDSFWFPGQVFSWETMIRLAEVDFKTVPQHLRERIVLIFTAVLTSSIAEDGANRIRGRADGNANKKCEQRTKWHALVSSSLIEDYDQIPVKNTNAARKVATDKTLSPSTFKCGTHDNILGELYEKFWQKATWANFAPKTREDIFVNFAAFDALKADTMKYESSWRSLLAIEGTCLFDCYNRTGGHRPLQDVVRTCYLSDS